MLLHTTTVTTRRTVHCTLRRPNKNATPVFQPPVLFIIPSEPNTYAAGCMSPRGVMASRTIMMTDKAVNKWSYTMPLVSYSLVVAPILIKTKLDVNLARWRVAKLFYRDLFQQAWLERIVFRDKPKVRGL